MFLVLIIDQISKIWIKLNWTIGQRTPLIDGLIELHFIENNGMAFGMEIPGSWGKIALSVFRIAAVLVIGLYLRRIIKDKEHPGFITCVTLILTGAVGNIIDSAFYGLLFGRSSLGTVAEFLPEGGGYAGFLHGNVVDMLHFTIRWPEWMPWVGEGRGEIFPPIFNIADAAITVGVIWILIRQKTYFAKPVPEVVETSEIEGGAEDQEASTQSP